MQQLTDGFMPVEIVRTIGTPTETRRLVEAGFWLPKDDGYVFHEFEQRQPTRVQVEAEREAARDRQRRARDAARAKRERKSSS
jgi:hypothetical protein